MVTRREVLTGAGSALVARPAIGRSSAASDRLATDLDHYVRLGVKASGGPGDMACGAWLESELREAGYATARHDFAVPFFEVHASQLSAGEPAAPVVPQAIVVPTGPEGITGPLAVVDPFGTDGALPDGAIAVLELPYRRWSSLHDGQIVAMVLHAFARGARATLLVTHGPTDKAIALNSDGNHPLFDRPLAVLAPEAFAAIRKSLAERVTLTIDGTAGQREAFNVTGRMDRGAGRWLVVSTPRSAWTIAAGERGPGVAAWLALARWAPKALSGVNLAFLCNSGHEYENLGAGYALDASAPGSAATALWLHLGANVAARDWHDLGGGRLLPLPSADPQRFLLASPPFIATAREVFAGISGLEIAYPAGPEATGELAEILGTGYGRVAGIFGAHRFHHTQDDDARCVDSKLVAPVVEACKRLIVRAVG